jgi:hypothetical protein
VFIMSDFGRWPLRPRHRVDPATPSAGPSALGDAPVSLADDHRRSVLTAQTRLLYENANTGVAITAVIAALLAYAQWPVVRPAVIVPWLAYMLVVSLARFVLARRYWRASPPEAA